MEKEKTRFRNSTIRNKQIMNLLIQILILILLYLIIKFKVTPYYIKLYDPICLKECFKSFFSVAVQAVATFIAFIITGYTFVCSLMDALSQKNAGLDEVHKELKSQYHMDIAVLSFFTCTSIILGLFMLLLNDFPIPLIETKWFTITKYDIAIITFLFNLFAIISGTLFVVSIINPDKYRKPAGALANEMLSINSSGVYKRREEFFRAFGNLELRVKSFLIKYNELYNLDLHFDKDASLEEMTNLLDIYRIIDDELHEELITINKYRNYVIIGKLDKVNEGAIIHIEKLTKEIDKLYQSKCKKIGCIGTGL
jgi:hypothetical protein